MEPLAARTLVENQHVVVTFDRAAGLVTITRLEVPFAGPEEMRRVMGDAYTAVASLGKAARTVLLDLRRAPGRNDPESERVVAGLVQEYMRGFSRYAVLVRSAAGVLQVQRVGRKLSVNARVFHDDEAAAREYLRTGHCDED